MLGIALRRLFQKILILHLVHLMNFDHISMEIQRKIKFPFSSCITGTGGLGWDGGGREQSSVSVD